MTAIEAAPRLLAPLALVLAAACAGTGDEPPRPPPPPPRDLVTDVRDDGSLVAGLFMSDPEVRWVAARGLGRMARTNPGEDEALLAAAKDESDEDVLAEMVFALGQRAHLGAGPDLARLLVEHGSPWVRAAAAEALGKLADDGHTAAQVAALEDEHDGVRGAAALALVRLDGRRYDHPRLATEAEVAARDRALARAATEDASAGVRWRAVYALASLRGRAAFEAPLRAALEDASPLARTFALRGLRELAVTDGIGSVPDGRPFLDDRDPRVAVEATRALVAAGDTVALMRAAERHPSAHVRRVAVEGVPDMLDGGALPAPAEAALVRMAGADASDAVRRGASAALAVAGTDRAGRLARLATSDDRRDRERAAALLARDDVADDGLLIDLLEDRAPTVRAAALEALPSSGLEPELWLRRALTEDDPAVLVAAADLAQPRLETGTAKPWLARAVAAAADRSPGPEHFEARSALRAALGVPARQSLPNPPDKPGRLLDRLIVEFRHAALDPFPTFAVETRRGTFVLELDRVAAPRHVASFAELARGGFYDGLDVHRVVPNFVVQGLDPRGDGWGTGGRRVPDEINRARYLTGTLGMPNAGEPHTGGCQIFVTHLPTPHLDGRYTAFGRVLDGMDVVQRLEVGDRVLAVRALDPAGQRPAPETPEREESE